MVGVQWHSRRESVVVTQQGHHRGWSDVHNLLYHHHYHHHYCVACAYPLLNCVPVKFILAFSRLFSPINYADTSAVRPTPY